MRCETYACHLSERACATRHTAASKAWKRELQVRESSRSGDRTRDDHQWSACRGCHVGAANAATHAAFAPKPEGGRTKLRVVA